MTRADVYEMNVEPIDRGHELRQGIQLRLRLPPVVARPPVANERLQLFQLDALRSIGNRFAVGPPRRREALAEIDDSVFRNLDVEGADCGCRTVRRRLRRFRGCSA